ERRNHPSIIMWVPFNKSWGQFETKWLTGWVKEYDDTRLVNNASGWHDGGVGDVIDIHTYPGPSSPPSDGARAMVIGEFGGLGLPVSGHTWQDEKNWGYKSYKDSDALTDAYLELVAKLKPLIGGGLSAAVYTQTTDVEVEVNGILTYDREVMKMDAEKIAAANRSLYEKRYRAETVMPDAHHGENLWKYRISKPAGDWYAPEYDDSKWREAPGGFGGKEIRNTVTRTEWNGAGLWLRKFFNLGSDNFDGLFLSVAAAQETRIYINGIPAAQLDGGGTGYAYIRPSEKALASMKPGKNTIAVQCKQLIGEHYFDMGIVRVVE
ncbi:glycoside hydrolase family 2 TIM barrel-domain containing protein, partial [bacterium]